MRVLVSGANGFVGGYVVTALRMRGCTVRAALRRAATRAVVPPDVESFVIGEMERANWQAVLDGVDAVVHLAARVHRMKDHGRTDLARAYEGANTETTARIADAALAAGARRFVFASSVKVHGEGRDAPYQDGDDPGPCDEYGRSKLAAERELLARRARGLEDICLRPPLVYGPGAGGNFRRLLRLAALSSRVPLPLGDIRNRRSFVYVENLADAIALAATTSVATPGSFLVADQPAVAISDFITALAGAAGRQARLFRCPPLLQRALRAVGFREELDRLTGSLVVDDARFRKTYAWAPPVTYRDAVERTARAWDGWR